MSFFASLQEELKLYFYDKWLLFCVSLLPLFLAFFIINIFQSGEVKNIPIGVVNLDKTKFSREIIRMANSTANLSINSSFTSYNEAFVAMQKREIYAIIIIPKNMQKNFQKGYSTSIPLYYNAQFILIGKSINSALTNVMANFNAKLTVINRLRLGNTKIEQAKEDAVPIQLQMAPLYNQSLNYAKYLLTAILPAIWQIIIVVSLVLNLTAQNNKTGILLWLKEAKLSGFLGKLFLHQILMMLLCLLFLNYFSFYKEWFDISSWSLLLCGAWLCVLGSQAMGLAFYFLTLHPAKALSLTAGFTAPSLAFMGITFPVTDMSTFAKIWNNLIPISHYIKIQIALTNYHFLSKEYLREFGALALFLGAFCVVILRIKSLLKKEFA